jgi:hypothetical protein
LQGAALEAAVDTIPGQLVWRRRRVVEPVHQQKTDPLVPPVLWGRERRRDADGLSADLDRDGGGGAGLLEEAREIGE